MRSIYLKRCLYIIGISILITIMNAFFNLNVIILPDAKNIVDFNFNLITINSIIAGFSFTTLGIILSLSGSEVIVNISKTDIMSNKSKKIISSIVFCCASIIISMLFVLQIHETILHKVLNLIFIKNTSKIYVTVINILYVSCIVYLLSGIIYFLKSIQEVSRLIGQIYKNKSKLSKKNISDFNKAIEASKSKKYSYEEDSNVFNKE